MAQTDYKTTIKIEGDSKSAEAAVSRTSTVLKSLLAPLHAIRTAISGVMRAFGTFYLAVEGVKSLVNAFTALKAKFDEIQTRAARLSFAKEVSDATAETKRLVAARSTLNEKLKEELGLLQKQKSLRDMKEQGGNSFADESTKISRALAIAGETDPNRRQLLQDRFAAEDEARARARRDAAYTSRIKNLDEEESVYSSKARGTAGKISEFDRQIAAEEWIYKRSATDEEKQASMKRLEALRETRKALEADKATFEEEAAYRRSQIAVLTQEQQQFQTLGGSAAAIADARWRDKDAEQRKELEAFAKRLNLKAEDAGWKRDYDAANPETKAAMLTARESAARGDFESLQAQLREELAKDVRVRDAQRIGDLQQGIGDAQERMFSARGERESLAAAAEERLAGYAGAFMGAAAPSGNRLTAMGLGAGAGVNRVQEQMATSLKDLVNIGRQQIAELKQIKETPEVAVYDN